MASSVISKPQRHFLTFVLSVGCWGLMVFGYFKDDAYWLFLGLALQALLVLDFSLRSRYLSGLGIALLFFFVLLGYPLTEAYYLPYWNVMRRTSNIQKITQAFIRYDEQYSRLPRAAIVDNNGRPLLSWRVELLPLLGYEELYRQFKLDEAWDSKHNRALLSMIPREYQPMGKRVSDGYTHTVVLRGKGSIFDEPTSVRMSQVEKADGLNMTVLLAESDKLIPWTKPEDEVVDPNLPPPSLRAYPIYGPGQSFSCLSFLDGRVIRLNNYLEKINAHKLHASVTWNGGEGGNQINHPEHLDSPK